MRTEGRRGCVHQSPYILFLSILGGGWIDCPHVIVKSSLHLAAITPRLPPFISTFGQYSWENGYAKRQSLPTLHMSSIHTFTHSSSIQHARGQADSIATHVLMRSRGCTLWPTSSLNGLCPQTHHQSPWARTRLLLFPASACQSCETLTSISN